jgi:hypothetical protein
MAIVERGEAFYVKVHRGRGRYEHVGTFRWDAHGGKRAARRVARARRGGRARASPEPEEHRDVRSVRGALAG